MLGMLGLTVDLGRMYIIRTELQTFVDAAAVAACFELDGTTQGINRAKALASTGPGVTIDRNRWNFSTSTVADVVTRFAQAPEGPYARDPASAVNYRFIEVTASADSPIYFLRLLPGVASNQALAARATAGQAELGSIGEGGAPFSPDAHDPSSPEFGFQRGTLYTLKWAPPGQRNKPGGRCPGDLNFNPGGGSSDRGYIDVGQGHGNAGLHDAIVNNDYFLSAPLEVGSLITTVNGNKHVGPAMAKRFNQDTDTTSVTYAQYNGNGRRLLIVPINDAQANARVVGFAAFFLQPNACTSNQMPCCGEYIGPAVVSSKYPGAAVAGLYQVRLFR